MQLMLFIFLRPLQSGGELIPLVPSTSDYMKAYECRIETESQSVEDDRRHALDSNNSFLVTLDPIITRLEAQLADQQTAIDEDLAAAKPASTRSQSSSEPLADTLQQLRSAHNATLTRLLELQQQRSELFGRNLALREGMAAGRERSRLSKIAAITEATSQHSKDVQAANRISELMITLKEFLLEIMKPFLEVTRVARTFVADSSGGAYDPLDRGNLREVYRNLYSEYRQTTLVQNMMSLLTMTRRLRQQKETMREYARFFEEQLRSFSDIGINSISMPDLCACLLLSGMPAVDQLLFLRDQDASQFRFVGRQDSDNTGGGPRISKDIFTAVLRSITTTETVRQTQLSLTTSFPQQSSSLADSINATSSTEPDNDQGEHEMYDDEVLPAAGVRVKHHSTGRSIQYSAVLKLSQLCPRCYDDDGGELTDGCERRCYRTQCAKCHYYGHSQFNCRQCKAV
jgi:hypothetical protein